MCTKPSILICTPQHNPENLSVSILNQPKFVGSQQNETVEVTNDGISPSQVVPVCTSCQEPITDSHFLKVDTQVWHEDCLRCHCCNCRLGELGSSLYTKAQLLLCKRDYLRMFGSIGYCNACEKVIPAFELVMRAGIFVYHLECFGCQECSHRFCVGDKYYLYGNRVLCEADYEEIMLYNKIASQIPINCNMILTNSSISSSSTPILSIAPSSNVSSRLSDSTNPLISAASLVHLQNSTFINTNSNNNSHINTNNDNINNQKLLIKQIDINNNLINNS